MISFGSVCSGIEAASVAWGPLGWRAAWLAEIEAFPAAVLAHHYPEVPNLGDMTQIAAVVRAGLVEAPDVLCGGTPCQAFSVAGLRRSLDDARGNLSLTFCELANDIDTRRKALGKPPAVVFWENVPGVLTTRDNAFGCFLAGLAGESDPLHAPGGKWAHAGVVLGPQRTVAWRTLDAQFFGVAQRRRRVFVVASARAGFDPAKVLFEFDGLRRDTAPRREAGQNLAGSLAARTDGGGFPGTDEVLGQPAVVGPLTAACGHSNDPLNENLVPSTAHTLRGEGFDASEDGTGRGTPLVPVCHVEFMPTMTAGGPTDTSPNQISGQMREQYLVPMAPAHIAEVSPCLRAGNQFNNSDPSMEAQMLVAFDTTQVTSATNRSNPKPGDPCHPLAAGAHPPTLVAFNANAQADQLPSAGRDTSVNDGLTCSQQAAVALQWQGGSAQDQVVSPAGVSPTLAHSSCAHGGHNEPKVLQGLQVRRLTPVECERLQGFPDGYTAIPWRGRPASQCPDGPRYKALGNSWAVPVVAWLGERIYCEILTAMIWENAA